MIVKVKNGAYEQYEQLLLQRDHYRKAAGQFLIAYTREFGDRINEVFEKKIECIRLKKTIAACQVFINRGETIDVDAMNERIRKEMARYYAQLEEILDETRTAKEGTPVPMAIVIEIRRIYRRLAKMLHPDINPMTSTLTQLMDIWNRVCIAYHSNNVEELRDLEVLARSALEQIGAGDISIEIPDIEDRIERLEREIGEILTTEPYTYRYLLADPEQAEEKKASLDAEFWEYEEYRQSLEKTLDAILIESGRTLTWRMR